ncbi:hypothetical protein [Weissella muntiaci]|uniref:hypothetical protein n=1 Tax=Weissella muntiaci TaxID=2508881 RepID=UPI001652303B|nr:hypothetical protein [Weissella muntiaci]
MRAHAQQIIFAVVLFGLFIGLMVLSSTFAWNKTLTFFGIVMLFIMTSVIMTKLTLNEKKRKRDREKK